MSSTAPKTIAVLHIEADGRTVTMQSLVEFVRTFNTAKEKMVKDASANNTAFVFNDHWYLRPCLKEAPSFRGLLPSDPTEPFSIEQFFSEAKDMVTNTVVRGTNLPTLQWRDLLKRTHEAHSFNSHQGMTNRTLADLIKRVGALVKVNIDKSNPPTDGSEDKRSEKEKVFHEVMLNLSNLLSLDHLRAIYSDVQFQEFLVDKGLTLETYYNMDRNAAANVLQNHLTSKHTDISAVRRNFNGGDAQFAKVDYVEETDKPRVQKRAADDIPADVSGGQSESKKPRTERPPMSKKNPNNPNGYLGTYASNSRKQLKEHNKSSNAAPKAKGNCSWCKREGHGPWDCDMPIAIRFRTEHSGLEGEAKKTALKSFKFANAAELERQQKVYLDADYKPVSHYPSVSFKSSDISIQFEHTVGMITKHFTKPNSRLLYDAHCLNSEKLMSTWLDCGARTTLVHENATKAHSLLVYGCPRVRLVGLNGSEVTDSRASIALDIKGEKIVFDAYVVSSSLLNGVDVLIGMDVIGTQIGLEVNSTDCPITLRYFPVEEEVADYESGTVKKSITWAVQETVNAASKSSRPENHSPPLKESESKTTSLSQPALVLAEKRLSVPSKRKIRPRPAKDSSQPWPKRQKLEDRDPSKQIRHTRRGRSVARQDSNHVLAAIKAKTRHRYQHTTDIDRILSKKEAKLKKKQTAKILKSLKTDKTVRYDLNQIPKSEVDEISAALRKAKPTKVETEKRENRIRAIRKEERRLKHLNPTTPDQRAKIKELTEQLKEKMKGNYPKVESKNTITEIKGITLHVACVYHEYVKVDEKLIEKNPVDYYSSRSQIDEEYEIAPVKIIAEPDDSLDMKAPVDWRSLPPKDEKYVPHNLDVNQKIKLNELVTTFRDTLVRDEESIPMGQARDVPEFDDVDLIEGGDEKLKKLNLKPYPVKGELSKKLKETLSEMKRAGVGQSPDPSKPTYYAFPAFFAKRPRSNKLRLCINYVPLNNETVGSVFPMPLINNVVEELTGKEFISVLDLKSGYHQFRLSERAKKYCVMITPEGLFQFNVLGFGLKNAVSFFQRVMSDIFKEGIEKGFLKVYVDDLIISSKTYEEHLKALEYVFETLKKHNLKASLSKCHFALQQARVLGLLVGADGVRPDPDLLKAVVEFPKPKTVQNVREFLGLTGHYRHFVKDYGPISKPLTLLTHNGEKFRWSSECEKAFEKLKELLCSDVVLAPIDWSKDLYLECDASKIGAGAVMSMKDNNGKLRPIAYASWLFNSAQQNYSATDREMLAIVLAARKFRSYLYGRKFKVTSDHKALSGNLNLSDPYGRIARWSAELANYDFDISYVKGTENSHADALSRNIPISSEEETAGIEVAASEFISLPSDGEWAVAQKEDPDYYPFIRWIKDGELPDDDDLARKVIRESDSYVIDDQGILCRINELKTQAKKDIPELFVKARRCVPDKFKKLICNLYHDAPFNGAHLGRSKTYERIARQFFWPEMYRHIAVYVKTCISCQKVKDGVDIATSPLGSLPVVAPWDMLCIDTWGPLPISEKGNKYVLTVVDAYSKWCIAIPIPSKKAATVAEALFTNGMGLGVPNRIHHDRGKEYCNQIIEKLAELYGIEDTKTSAYHPQGNAFAERIHQFFGNAISAYTRDDQRDWDMFCPTMCLSYNNAFNETTGFSPAQILLGRDLRAPGLLPVYSGLNSENPKDYGDKLKSVLERVQKAVYQKIHLKRLLNAKKTKDIPLTVFNENDKVWLYVPRVKPGKVRKLTPFWTGPFTVVRRALNDKVYYLKNEFNEELKTAVSLSRLKSFHKREEIPTSKVNEAVRVDVNNALLNDHAVSRVIREQDRNFNADKEPELGNEDEIDSIHDINDKGVVPELIFEKPKVITPKEHLRVPLKNFPSNLMGDHVFVDGDEVVFKTRYTYEGKRFRKYDDRIASILFEFEDEFI